jgi:hypothetical protein
MVTVVMLAAPAGHFQFESGALETVHKLVELPRRPELWAKVGDGMKG